MKGARPAGAAAARGILLAGPPPPPSSGTSGGALVLTIVRGVFHPLSWFVLGLCALQCHQLLLHSPPPWVDATTVTTALTRTQELGLPLSSTTGYSGILPLAEVQPLHGEELVVKSFTSFPSGYSCSETCCCGFGGVKVGEYLWFIPEKATAVVRMHTVTGDMISYSDWPSGVSVAGNRFSTALYNAEQERIWMIPLKASQVVYMDVNSGTMGFCPTWPSGYSVGSVTYKSYTGFIQAGGGQMQYLWFPPADSNMVVRYDMLDCTPSGYNSWPSGYSIGSDYATTAAYDGEHTMWILPWISTTIAIVKLNLWDFSMVKHDNWPATFSGGSIFTRQPNSFLLVTKACGSVSSNKTYNLEPSARGLFRAVSHLHLHLQSHHQ